MKKICLIILIIFLALFWRHGANAQFDPQNGGSTVNAGVTQGASATPTATPTNIPTATLTPTQAPGTTATPTPTLPHGVTATNTPTPTLTSKEIYINISGFASPNATIVLTSNNVFLKSITADSEGYFSMSQVKVDQANGKVCFDTIDFKRVGTSYVCLPIPNTKEKFTNDSVFLPPTMGLSARKISSKGSALAFGYSMPNSKITTFISEGRTIKSDANDSGYYKTELSNLPVGTYYLFATAEFEKENSEKTDKPLELQSLSPGGLVVEETKDNLEKLFPWWLLIVIAIFILIIILLARRYRERIRKYLHLEKKTKLHSSTSNSGGKKLHHDWML